MSRGPRGRAAVAVFAGILLWIPPCARGDVSGLFDWLFSDLNLVSVEQEAEISRELARDVESKQPIVRDREIEAYVSDLGDRLVGVLRRPDFRYRFLVVGDRTVNAFGIGGGRIYVNAGLLAAADTEGQVA